MHRLVAPLVAIALAAVLYLNLDSGLVAREPAPRAYSLPLGGLAVLFSVRAWTASMHPTARRWAGLYTGLAIALGCYALVRLF